MFTSYKTENHSMQPLPTPLYAWLSGIDYVFGYQLKLVKEFWGIAEDEA
ncbi:MAG: hypothetical protein QG619_1982 [Pseudomonadota bacterium]|nr:hypothetical protein [Pseudomonadota bacterium]